MNLAEMRMELLRIAGGGIDLAKRMEEWVRPDVDLVDPKDDEAPSEEMSEDDKDALIRSLRDKVDNLEMGIDLMRNAVRSDSDKVSKFNHPLVDLFNNFNVKRYCA